MSESNNAKTAGIIIIIVFVLAGGVWYFFMYKPEQEAKEKARLELIAKQEAEQKAKELAAQKKSQYDQLIKTADAEFQQENWQAAYSGYNDASALLPNEKYAKDQRALAKAKLDEQAELEARRAAGVVEKVTSRTGRYYIIVSSSIDDDLAMDYASKLAKEGNAVKFIEHETDKLVFYRVSVGDYDTREAAESVAASFTSYGEGVWVLGY